MAKDNLAYELNITDNCSICLTPLLAFDAQGGLLETPCRHLYHKNCLVEWLINGIPGGYCPKCKTEVTYSESRSSATVREGGAVGGDPSASAAASNSSNRPVSPDITSVAFGRTLSVGGGAVRGRPVGGGARRGRPVGGGARRGRPVGGGARRGRPVGGGARRGRPVGGGARRGRPVGGGAAGGNPSVPVTTSNSSNRPVSPDITSVDFGRTQSVGGGAVRGRPVGGGGVGGNPSVPVTTSNSSSRPVSPDITSVTFGRTQSMGERAAMRGNPSASIAASNSSNRPPTSGDASSSSGVTPASSLSFYSPFNFRGSLSSPRNNTGSSSDGVPTPRYCVLRLQPVTSGLSNVTRPSNLPLPAASPAIGSRRPITFPAIGFLRPIASLARGPPRLSASPGIASPRHIASQASGPRRPTPSPASSQPHPISSLATGPPRPIASPVTGPPRPIASPATGAGATYPQRQLGIGSTQALRSSQSRNANYPFVLRLTPTAAPTSSNPAGQIGQDSSLFRARCIIRAQGQHPHGTQPSPPTPTGGDVPFQTRRVLLPRWHPYQHSPGYVMIPGLFHRTPNNPPPTTPQERSEENPPNSSN